MFDAYTVKKVLPRLVIAAILIQLSWEIFTLLISLVSQIAWGLEGLLYAPFGGREALNLTDLIANSALGSGSATGITFAGAAIAVGSAISSGYLLLLALSAFLGILLAFFLLTIRELVIIMLVVIAPLALVAWILPNTEKFWKLWWESFTKLLLIYPLILLIVAMGRVFAKITIDSGTANAIFDLLIIVIGFFGPYYLIPKTFQVAGSAFTFLAGMTNDRARGAFDRLKNARQKSAATTFNKARNYGRFSDRNALTRGLNRRIGAATNPRDIMKGREGILAGQRRGRTLLGAETLKDDKTFQANQNDDNFLLAVANEDLARRKLKLAETERDEAVERFGANSSEAISAQSEVNARQGALSAAQLVPSRRSSSTRLAALNALAKTGYQLSPGDAGYRELYSTIQSITGDDASAFSAAMNEAQFHLKGAGRAELAGINHGAGIDAKSGIRKLNSYARGQGKPDTYKGGAEAWLGSGSVSKTGKTSAESIQQAMDTALYNGSTSIDDIAEWHSILLRDLPGATEANRQEIRKQIEAIESYRMPQSAAGSGVTSGSSPLAERLAQNRAELQRESGLNIDPSEREK